MIFEISNKGQLELNKPKHQGKYVRMPEGCIIMISMTSSLILTKCKHKIVKRFCFNRFLKILKC